MPDYKVTVEGSDPIPVRAANKDGARNYAVRQKVTVAKLTTEDAIAFGVAGVPLQIAGEEQAAEPEPENEEEAESE